MTPADLPRLAGLLHHLPDARDLRTVDKDGAAHDLPWQAVEVYAAVPELVEMARESAAAMVGKTEAIRHHHMDVAALYAALRLPASTPWADVLARARRLSDQDPTRTLDDEPPADAPGDGRLTAALAVLDGVDLESPPPCPDCGGQLSDDSGTDEDGPFFTYTCPVCSWMWGENGADEALTIAIATWTRDLAEVIRRAREVGRG